MRIRTTKETIMKKCTFKKNNLKILLKKEKLRNIVIKIISLLTHQDINIIKITKNHIYKVSTINIFQMNQDLKINMKYHIQVLKTNQIIDNKVAFKMHKEFKQILIHPSSPNHK
jgi:hypothetical protein